MSHNVYPTIEEQKEYERKQKDFGVVEGAEFTIAREAKSYSEGWCNCWAEDMSRSIGKKVVVKQVYGAAGIQFIGTDHLFPYFCLDKTSILEMTEDAYND